MKQKRDEEDFNKNDRLIIIIKEGYIKGMFSNIENLMLDVDIINYDLQTIDTEEEYRRKRLERELKTMVKI